MSESASGNGVPFDNIIQWLQNVGLLSDDEADHLLDPQNAVALPEEESSVERAWYVKFLIGVSAWIAAIFLISGVLGVAFFTDELIQLAAGAVLLAAAVGLNWKMQRSIFWRQFAFALSLTGQGLILAGLGGLLDLFSTNALDAIRPFAAVVLVLQIALFFIYRNSVHRFLSVLLASLTGMVLVADSVIQWELWGRGTEQVVNSLLPLFLVGFAAATFLVWQNRTRLFTSRWYECHSPLGFGLVVIMFGLAFLTLIPDNQFAGIAPRWWMASIALALLLAHFAIQTIDELGATAQSLLIKVGIVAAIGLLLIPTYDTPGIWAALLAMLLGFRHNHQLLLWFSALFLLGFIGLYYYSLNITLLNKSYVLVGSGLILLAARFVLGRLWIEGGSEPNEQIISSQTGELSA